MTSETANQNHIRRVLHDRGDRLYRNNRGVLKNENGTPVRYGLANGSREEAEALKTGDLIGWETVLITPDMVGQCFARFKSVEVKPTGWKPPGPGPIKDARDKLTAYGHYVGQKAWADLVNDEGGVAGFMIDPEEGFLEI